MVEGANKGAIALVAITMFMLACFVFFFTYLIRRTRRYHLGQTQGQLQGETAK